MQGEALSLYRRSSKCLLEEGPVRGVPGSQNQVKAFWGCWNILTLKGHGIADLRWQGTYLSGSSGKSTDHLKWVILFGRNTRSAPLFAKQWTESSSPVNPSPFFSLIFTLIPYHICLELQLNCGPPYNWHVYNFKMLLVVLEPQI